MKSFHRTLHQSSPKFLSPLSLPKTPPPSNPPLPLQTQPPHTLPINQTNPNNNAHLPKSPNSHSATSPVPARKMLDKIPQPNPTSQSNDPARYFAEMHSRGLNADHFHYGNALSACASSRNVEFGTQISSLVMKNGFFSNGYVVTGLIDLFAKSGRFGDAVKVFEANCGGNVVCWNAIVAGAVRNGENMLALDLFRRMARGFCMPNGFTFSSILSACAASGELEMGRAVHGWVIKRDVGDDVFVGTGIVDLYAKCGDMDDAVKEFSQMPARNVVSWTVVISGFVQREDAGNAVKLFKEMTASGVEVNKYALTSVLLACAKSFMVKEAMQIHCWTFKNGPLFADSVVKEAFISTYARVGNIAVSDKIFEEMGSGKSPSTWSAMICGLAQSQSLTRSMDLYKMMFHEGLRPDTKCTSSVLSIIDSMEVGAQIHSYVVKVGSILDMHVASALFTMYSKCGSLDDSYELFSQMNERDTVSWTSMVSGFAVHGHSIEALQLFKEMILEGIRPDETIMSSVLTACCDSQFLMKGKEIHAHALRNALAIEAPVGSALVSMYSRCKNLSCARRVYHGFPCKDKALCASLVSAYSTNGHNEAALSEFRRMVVSGFGLDHIISSSVLRVCANLSKVSLGKQLHAHGIKGGLVFHLSVSSALVTMYTKCGIVSDSQKVFDEIQHPDLVTWTALIDGYAQHGRGLEALGIFERMKRQGTNPDSVTYLSVLSACNHNGLVEEGFTHFNSMKRDYGIEPEQHHYASMVDLLGRLGSLKEAANFIDKMPVEADWLVWSVLLGACRVHGDADLGMLAAKKVRELAPQESGAYVSASNISAEMGDWDEVLRIRSSMKGVGVRKDPGWSIV